MESAAEIIKLCETWWGKRASYTKGDQSRLAGQFLELLGWRAATPLEARTGLAQMGAAAYALRGSAQTAIAAYFVMPGVLEPPARIIQQGLDFCEATKTLVQETYAFHADYAFITDIYRTYLYDVRTGELILSSNSPADFRNEFGEVLTRPSVERGALDEVRRQPRSYVARQLRQWRHHWCERFAAETRLSEDLGELVIDRLFVLRYLFDHDILKRSGWRLRQRFSQLAARALSSRPQGCGQQLTALFHDIWFDWRADLFAAIPELNEALERDELVAPLIKEFSLHSRSKFSIATILESFNYGEAAEKARVRMVPDYDEDRENLLAKQTLDTIDTAHVEVDLADEGYRAVFYWFDKLVALYDRLEADFDQRQYRLAPHPEEFDLFMWSEMAASRPEAFADKFRHAVEHGLTVYFSSPRQLRTGRLMLCLYLISRYDETGQRFTGFPKMDDTFKHRPPVLETDRKWIYQPQQVEEWLG